MTQIIVAPTLHPSEHLLGQFLDEQHYDTLIETDTDFYLPPIGDVTAASSDSNSKDCETRDLESQEDRVAFKFRKNYFTKAEQDQAYAGLRDCAAGFSHNRGLAAGPMAAISGNRITLDNCQLEILNYFLSPMKPLDLGTGIDPIQLIRESFLSGTKVIRGVRCHVWLSIPVDRDQFKFDDWVAQTQRLSNRDMINEAHRIMDTYISDTHYANPTNSNIAGWFDRYPRIPYGRATSYTRDHPAQFQMSFPFLQHLSKGFQDLMPQRYRAQQAAASQIDPRFLVPGTPLTTITVNKTFRTAAHRDAGDLNTGLSNLLVLSNTGNFTGGYLILPQVRVAINVRPGDLLLINNHECIHANTPIVLLDDDAERVSLVCYFREAMLGLGSYEYEDCRFQFVESRRLNPQHPNQRERWNGVSEGMFESPEWYEFLREKLGEEVVQHYHPTTNPPLNKFFS